MGLVVTHRTICIGLLFILFDLLFVRQGVANRIVEGINIIIILN